MATVLTFCGREWQAQRGLLVAYTLVAFGSLCLVLLLVPSEWWREEGQGALALSWFVAVGVAGVVAFVAPNLVRSEYGSTGDQFVRRLPGALLPSFLGKLLFLALVAAALPLVCLLAGQGFLLAIGQSWNDLFEWRYDGDVLWRLPRWLPALGYAALLLPWVWAIGIWLPKGRMAVGGTIVFVLLLAFGVFAVLRQSPQIEVGIAWWNWLWLVPVLGVVVAAVSWGWGRRGGGALRSARCGLAATALGLLPPSLWFANRAVDYHYPDPQHLVQLGVSGLTPDGRYVLAHGAMDHAFFPVPFRIDLHDGSAVQLGAIHTWFAPSWQRPWQLSTSQRRRWWPFQTMATDDHRLRRAFDLEQLRDVELAWREDRDEPLDPEGLRGLLGDELRASTRLRAPGGRRVWWQGHELCFEVEGGGVERMPWPGELPVVVHPAGHGMRVAGTRNEWFDLVSRRRLDELPTGEGVTFIRGAVARCRLGNQHRPSTWRRRLPDGADERVDGLDGCSALGLVDDDHLLLVRAGAGDGAGSRMLLWHVHADTRRAIAVPAALASARWSVVPAGSDSVIPREPGGRVALFAAVHDGDVAQAFLVLLDVDAARIETVCRVKARNWNSVVDWLGAGVALLAEGGCLVRLELATGAREQLFPRRP